MDTKTCIKCGLIKPISSFSKQRKNSIRLRGICIRCGDAHQDTPEGKDRRKLYHKRYLMKYRSIVFEHYGNKCFCPKCPEPNSSFLTLDHVNNDGFKDTRTGLSLYQWIIKNNFPDTFQLLCWNCNCGRHYNGGVCPHLH